MRVGHLRGIVASFIVCLVALLVLSGIPGLSEAYTPQGTGTRQGSLTLIVGGQDEMKTRNLLPASANDVWTSDVHYRSYHSLLLGHPTLDRPMAFIAKGVDVNEDGQFDPNTEYDQWRKEAGTNGLDVTVYYDFNGVYWQDSAQMDVWDVLFSYHVSAQNARFNTDLRVLYCSILPGTSYESCGRQLNMEVVDTDGNHANGYQKNWLGEGTMAGDPAKRVAIRYTLNEAFALFYESTLFPTMMPMHEWSRAYGGVHADFGCAVWIPPTVASARNIAACGNADPAKWGLGIASTETVTGSRPYNYPAAESWNLRDQDIIGNGPFDFDTWQSGVEAKVDRFEYYYTGIDTKYTADTGDDVLIDPKLTAILKKPTIDGIRYKVYRTTQLGVFALQNGEVDFYHWNVGADFVQDLLKVPEIAVEANAEPGFFYMAYNFRREPWGYQNGDKNQPDVGYVFRQAVRHLADKKSIVQNLLGNFGVIGHGTISPANTFWYNDNIPKPAYDLTQARAILDSPAARAVGILADPPGACSKDTASGCRSLGVRGTLFFEILTPQADYDPVRASAGAMVADAMRQVGINAVARPTAFGEIVNKINVHDFDVYILGWRIGGTDPDYLFSFFHSTNAAAGQNYGGFQNDTFDQVIDDSRAELDRTTRQTLIFQAQSILADARPYEVLYYRTNIEGYRQDRFVNWTVASGTIWNYWSLEGIRPPSAQTIRLVISAVSATKAGATESVVATVFDNENQALAGATVTLSVGQTADQGELQIGTGARGKTVTGTTNANGVVRANYYAADATVITGETQVLILGTANHPSFPDPSSRQVILRVFPPGVSFLSISLDLEFGDRVARGSTLPVRISVADQDGNAVSDAQVRITVSRTGLTPSQSTGTAAQMASLTFTAESTAPIGDYGVLVNATKTGFEDGFTLFTVTVVAQGGGGTYTRTPG